jgi:hypothetical protein
MLEEMLMESPAHYGTMLCLANTWRVQWGKKIYVSRCVCCVSMCLLCLIVVSPLCLHCVSIVSPLCLHVVSPCHTHTPLELSLSPEERKDVSARNGDAGLHDAQLRKAMLMVRLTHFSFDVFMG